MEPRHSRMDPLALWVQHLDQAVPHPVVAAADVTLDPTQEPVSVVQVTSYTPTDPAGIRRWSFDVSLLVITYAGTISPTMDAHWEIADAILNTTRLDGGRVRVSSIRCTQEPEDVPVQSASDWPGQLSAYPLSLRRED